MSTGWRPRRSSAVGRADVADGHVAADEFAQPGQDLDVEAGVVGQVGELPDQVGGGAGERHQQGVGLVLVGRLRHPGAVAHHRHAHDPQVPLGRVVVEEGHGEVGARRVAEQGGDDLRPGVAGAEHQEAVDVGTGRPAALLVVAADEVPGRAHEDEGDDAAADHDAERHEPVRLAQLDQEQRRRSPRPRCGRAPRPRRSCPAATGPR